MLASSGLATPPCGVPRALKVRQPVRAQIVLAQEALRRHNLSNRRRRDGWLIDAPANLAEAGRKALDEARNTVPFRFLAKALSRQNRRTCE